jgi:hypothetical protein
VNNLHFHPGANAKDFSHALEMTIFEMTEGGIKMTGAEDENGFPIFAAMLSEELTTKDGQTHLCLPA